MIEGTTAVDLVSYMDRHPVEGDHGHAYASIHPDYQLSLTTTQSGASCRASQVDVAVTFQLTLPVAASPEAMGRNTRAAWGNFVGFARNHEEHHRESYLGCAAAFVAAAKRESEASCFGLESDIRSQLRDAEQACEAKQVPFDRSQGEILPRLSLFRMADQY